MSSRTAAAQAAKARIRDAAQVRILDAAAEVFARKSLAGATMAEIAEAAAMPAATVHYYFGNKAGLYDAVLRGMLEAWLGELDHIDPDASPAEAIAAYIKAKMHISHSHPAASRIVAGEMLRGGVRLRAFLVDTFAPRLNAKLELVATWTRESRLRQIDPMRLFFLIWASTEFYANYASEIAALDEARVLDDVQVDATAESIVDLILYGVVPRVVTVARAPDIV